MFANQSLRLHRAQHALDPEASLIDACGNVS